MLLGEQPPGMIAARACQMGVEVHSAGHDHHAFDIDGGCIRREISDDLPIFNTDVPNHTIDPVGWVVDRSTGDAEL
jgi:hypothetical protein